MKQGYLAGLVDLGLHCQHIHEDSLWYGAVHINLYLLVINILAHLSKEF